MTSSRAPLLVAFAAAVWASACTSTHEVKKPLDYVPRAVVEVARYEVRSGTSVLGVALELEIRDPSGPLRFWRIQTRDGAWAGHATEQGRFSRRVPFREDEEDLGVWPMAQGIAKVLDVPGPVQLAKVQPKNDAAQPQR
jgi:hypothetical protein